MAASGGKWSGGKFYSAAKLAEMDAAKGAERKTAGGGSIRERADAAYEEVKKSFGFTDVRISDVQEKSGIPMDQFKQHLLEGARTGRVLLGKGDWSLSSEKIRSGAVYLYGKTKYSDVSGDGAFLMFRFVKGK